MKGDGSNNIIYEEIKELKLKLNNNNKTIKNEISTTIKTYSKIVTKEAIVIKPKAVQECYKTKEVLLKKLLPCELKVDISQMKNIGELY